MTSAAEVARRQRAFALFEQFCALAGDGAAPDQAEFLASHPDCADALRELFEALAVGARGLAQQREAFARAEAALGEELARLRAGDRYQRRAELGRGGMGVVFRVRDRKLGRELAMKVIRDQSGAAGGAARSAPVRRFLREARITAGLDHPGIVPLHDVGVTDEGDVYYTMKLVDGVVASDLFAAWRQQLQRQRRRRWATFAIDHAGRRWRLADLLAVLARVCEAVAFAHERGVVHRDLKPANIMVGRHGETYVMDWGLACGIDEVRDQQAGDETPGSGVRSQAHPALSVAGAVLGTGAYMAPEQARGDRALLGPHSDVYALGAMLYELLAGRSPHELPGGTAAAAVAAHAGRQAPAPLADDAGPPELLAIIRRAIEPGIDRRLPTAAALAEQLQRFLEGRVVSIYATGPWQELRKWFGRNRMLAGAVVAAVAALVAGLAGTLRGYAEADLRAAQAGRLAAELHRKVQDFDQLAAVVRLDRAVAAEAALHPAWPTQAAAMAAWLRDDCEPLLAQRPALERTVRELADAMGAAAPAADQMRSAGEAQVFLLDTLRRLLDRMDALAGLQAAVAHRLAFAQRIRELSLAHPHARHSWAEARAAIAAADGVVASTLYAGCTIALCDDDVIGLVPIGMNPVTRLWEFYDLRSACDGTPEAAAAAAIPAHRADGTIDVDAATGIVFVLLPGGDFTTGAQKSDGGARRHDPQSVAGEELCRTTLAPFLLARHELTRAQWQRLAGSQPFRHKDGESYEGDPVAVGPVHPAEMISWEEADACLRHIGACLPTEAQWEHGCRGGTDTPWWPGARAADLAGCDNLHDQTSAVGRPSWGEAAPFADGFCGIAPVGRFRGNPFGLHDLHGNVFEWCRDWAELKAPGAPLRPGDGLRLADGTYGIRAGRGGACNMPPQNARSAFRISSAPTARGGNMGLRAARQLPPVERG